MRRATFRERFFFTSLLSVTFAVLTAAPSALVAQGADFYRCVDRDGGVTITNRHYDERIYRCTPYTDLNRAFQQAATREKRTAAALPPAWQEREVVASKDAARISAEAARTSMEAARTAAEAAQITAEAVRSVLTPYVIVVSPQR
jgi:hypothetical protein